MDGRNPDDWSGASSLPLGVAHGSTGHHRLWRPETVGSNIHFDLACRNIACDGVFEDLQNLRATLLAGMESGGATDKRAVDEGQKPP